MISFKIFLILLLLTGFSRAQWIPTNGPNGGNVNVYAINGSTIALGTKYGGVYFSTDYGINWNEKFSGLPSTQITSLLFTGNGLFAGTDGSGIYMTSNGGISWIPRNSGLTGHNITSLISEGSDMFAGTYAFGVFKSTDSGLNWSQVNNGLDNTYVNRLVSIGSYIFAGTYSHLFSSSNGGQSWSQSSVPLSYIFSLALYNNQIFAAGGIYESIDFGNNWINIPAPFAGNIYDIEVNNTNLYATGRDQWSNWRGIYTSTNSGANWSLTSFPIIGDTVNDLFADNNNIFAGTIYGNYRSSDNGASWILSNKGMNDVIINNLFVTGNKLLASSYGACIQATTDDGSTWNYSNSGIVSPYPCTMGPFYNFHNKLYTANNRLYISSNNGVSWGNPIIIDNQVLGINAFSSWGNKLFAVVKGNGSGGRYGVWESDDDGLSWSLLSTIFNSHYRNTLTVAVLGNYLFAGTYAYQGLSYSGLFRTDINNINWVQINNGISTYPVYSLAVKNNLIFAGTGTGIYVSSDTGTSWTQVNSGLTDLQVNTLITYNNLVFAGTASSVFYTSNNGANWIQINSGLPNAGIRSLAVQNNYLFAGTNGHSVWKYTLSSIIGIQIPNSQIPETFRLYQNYPNPFNPATKISYDLPSDVNVKLVIYDALGREVKTLVNEKQNAGTHEIEFDASNYPSGVYFYKLETSSSTLNSGFTETKKMVLLK